MQISGRQEAGETGSRCSVNVTEKKNIYSRFASLSISLTDGPSHSTENSSKYISRVLDTVCQPRDTRETDVTLERAFELSAPTELDFQNKHCSQHVSLKLNSLENLC